MHLAALKSYSETQKRLGPLYVDRDGWATKAIQNVARSGKFFERPHQVPGRLLGCETVPVA